MARIPKRLVGPAQFAASTATLYTVPSLTKTIIRHIHLSNPTGTAVAITMSIGADAAAVRIFDAFSLAAGSVYDYFCYYIVDAAETLRGHASSATAVVYIVNGDEIVLG